MIALADERSLGDKAFANIFVGSFFRFAWHFLQNSLSVSIEVGILLKKLPRLELASQQKLPGTY